MLAQNRIRYASFAKFYPYYGVVCGYAFVWVVPEGRGGPNYSSM